MRLTKVQVKEFKSVQDSGQFTVGDVTCLVGKNESGKTALLEALYRLNPIVDADAKFDVTDIWLASDGTAFLSGTVIRGKLRGVIPDKVQVLTSQDLENWTPIAVDYRAEATATILAASDDDHLWMATDTGMILRLVR